MVQTLAQHVFMGLGIGEGPLAHTLVYERQAIFEPFLCQKQRRCLLLALGVWRGFDRQSTPDADFLGGITSQLAEMFAGPPLDPYGLVAPGRTGARIDSADVLEDIRLATRSLHFH